MKLVVDKIEGKFAVCQDSESKKMVDLDTSILPNEIHSGDLIELSITILPNNDEEQEIQRKVDSLWT